MPTYEYACKKCGEHIEVVQSFSDDPLTKCPSCKGQLRKVFGSIGITFKGSGFYKTDSRSTAKSSSSPASSSSGDSSSSDSKSTESKSTESKSTDKTGTKSDSSTSTSSSSSAAAS